MKKPSVLLCVLVVVMLFTGVASAGGTYEVVTAIQEDELGSTQLAESGSISDWQPTSSVSSITADSSISTVITFNTGLTISIKNEISEFVLGVSYNWEETYGIGVTCDIDSSQGDWARLVGQIHEKEVRVTLQHAVYGDVSKSAKGTTRLTLIETYYTYEDIWVPYNTSVIVEYADGVNPPTYKNQA